MDAGRRTFLGILLPAAVIGGAVAAGGAPLPQQPPPGRPPVLPPEEFPKVDKKVLLKDNQKQIQQDVQKLYTLAEQLKEEVSKTDSTSVLSLSLVHKAEEIEKLAKQIKNLARD
jgi:hypothetical protein